MRATKARAYSRDELRRRRRAWRRRNAKVILQLVALTVVLLAVVTVVLLLLPSTPSAASWYLLGAAHAGTVVALLGMLTVVHLVNDGGAMRHVRGAWGEEATRDVLRAARRRRVIWGWVDSITLQHGDIDHLVVTRRGGVYAIDSTWSERGTPPALEEMARAAGKVRLRAQGVVRTVLPRDPGRHSSRGPTVRPLVVVWGPGREHITEDTSYDGVPFVAGPDLREWLRQQQDQPVGRKHAGRLLRALRDYRAQVRASAVRPDAASRRRGTRARETAPG